MNTTNFQSVFLDFQFVLDSVALSVSERRTKLYRFKVHLAERIFTGF